MASFNVGDVVRLSGLSSADGKFLNGACGTVQEQIGADGRVAVLIPGRASYRFRPTNLSKVSEEIAVRDKDVVGIVATRSIEAGETVLAKPSLGFRSISEHIALTDADKAAIYALPRVAHPSLQPDPGAENSKSHDAIEQTCTDDTRNEGSTGEDGLTNGLRCATPTSLSENALADDSSSNSSGAPPLNSLRTPQPAPPVATSETSGAIVTAKKTRSTPPPVCPELVRRFTLNEIEGCGVDEVLSRLNHSCDPNCAVEVDTTTGNVHLYAVAAIKEGEELTVSYVPLAVSTKQRTETLKWKGIVCSCRRCVASSDDKLLFDANVTVLRVGERRLVKARVDNATGHNTELALTTMSKALEAVGFLGPSFNAWRPAIVLNTMAVLAVVQEPDETLVRELAQLGVLYFAALRYRSHASQWEQRRALAKSKLRDPYGLVKAVIDDTNGVCKSAQLTPVTTMKFTPSSPSVDR